MIVLLNGPFGVGKTSVANALVQQAPELILFDPEKVGVLVRDLLGPVEQVADFQDYAVWRKLVVDVARRLRAEYDRPVIMPMTIWRADYFDAIVGGLRRIDASVLCVRLTATRETVLRRILGRLDAEGSHNWCIGHLDVCLSAAANPHFGVEVATDGRAPADIARTVLSLMADDSRALRERPPGKAAHA